MQFSMVTALVVKGVLFFLLNNLRVHPRVIR
jgi:hypothetical protein